MATTDDKYLNGAGVTELVDGLKGLFTNTTKTEAEAIAASSTTPNTVYYASDTHNIVRNGNVMSAGIAYGQVASTSTSTAFTATVPGITEYKDGIAVLLRNNVVTSAANFTINVNGLGAKPCYNSMATGSSPTRDSTIFNSAYTMLFIYSSTIVTNGGWICYRGYNSNDNTIGYQLRTNSTVLKASDTSRYYKIFFTSADGKKWVPASANSTNNATSARTVNQRPIDPFGRIAYTSASTSYAADADVAAATLWQQYNLTLGYSFNRTGAALTLTSKNPVYIKCAPQSDGSAIIDADTPYVQSLPSTADGKIYIFLGIATSATAVEMFTVHPVYYYKDGAIRQWTNAKEWQYYSESSGQASVSVESQSGDSTAIINSETTSTGGIGGIQVQANGDYAQVLVESNGETGSYIAMTNYVNDTETAEINIGNDIDLNVSNGTVKYNNNEVATVNQVNAKQDALTFTDSTGTAISGTTAGSIKNIKQGTRITFTPQSGDFVKIDAQRDSFSSQHILSTSGSDISLKNDAGTTIEYIVTSADPEGAIAHGNASVQIPTLEVLNAGLATKQNTIDSSHKLSADLIQDGTTNKAYTATEQTKLSGIEANANNYSLPTASDSTLGGVKVTNGSIGSSTTGYVDPFAISEDHLMMAEATTSAGGAMSASDKTKLDGIATGAEVNVQADWNEASSSSDAYIQNKPTIPTVNDTTITIQKNGITVDTFTTNASSAKTINITGVQNTLTFDSAPTSASTNPVTSGGVYTALASKQNTLTFDSTPTASSTNPATSGGIYTALKTLVIRDKTEAQALAQSTSNPDYIYYTSDTNCIVVNGHIYGRGGQLGAAFAFATDTSGMATWDTSKLYLTPTATDGVYQVYSYENNSWEMPGTISLDIPVSADAITYDLTNTPDLGEGDVQSAIETLDEKVTDMHDDFIKEWMPSFTPISSRYAIGSQNGVSFTNTNDNTTWTLSTQSNTNYRAYWTKSIVKKGTIVQIQMISTVSTAYWRILGYSTSSPQDYYTSNSNSIIGFVINHKIGATNNKNATYEKEYIMPEDGYIVYTNINAATTISFTFYDSAAVSEIADRFYQTGIADSCSMASITGLGYDITKYFSFTYSSGVNLAGFEYGASTRYKYAATLPTVTGNAMFQSNTQLVYMPIIPQGSINTLYNICYNATNLLIFKCDWTINASAYQAFRGCSKLKHIELGDNVKPTNMESMFRGASAIVNISKISTENCTTWTYSFATGSSSSLQRIEEVDFTKCTTTGASSTYNWLNAGGGAPPNLRYILIKNLGTPSNCTALHLESAANWGVNTTAIPDSKQSLIDSLITYSFDRVAAGYGVCTITLSTNAKNALTDDEKAAITAKGYTIA